jgi:hypothetical protein
VSTAICEGDVMPVVRWRSLQSRNEWPSAAGQGRSDKSELQMLVLTKEILRSLRRKF